MRRGRTAAQKTNALERDTEHYARGVIDATNLGVLRKFTSPGRRGPPDNIALWFGARCDFIEFKKLGEKPNPQQLAWHRLLEFLGFDVFVLDTRDKVDEYVRLRTREGFHPLPVPGAGA